MQRNCSSTPLPNLSYVPKFLAKKDHEGVYVYALLLKENEKCEKNGLNNIKFTNIGIEKNNALERNAGTVRWEQRNCNRSELFTEIAYAKQAVCLE